MEIINDRKILISKLLALLVALVFQQGCAIDIGSSKLIEKKCYDDIGKDHIKFAVMDSDSEKSANGVEVLVDEYSGNFELIGVAVEQVDSSGIVAILYMVDPKVSDKFTEKYSKGRKFSYFMAYDDAFDGQYCIRAEYGSKKSNGGSGKISVSSISLIKENSFQWK